MTDKINGRIPDEIKKGLECREIIDCYNSICPYFKEVDCLSSRLSDALALIRQLESEKWELFDRLSSAWYGKGCYFKQEDGTVYSRMSGEYLSFDQAVDEFESRLTAIEEVE